MYGYPAPGQAPPPVGGGYYPGQQAPQTPIWQNYQFTSQDELASLFQRYCSRAFQGVQAEELCKIMNESQNIRSYYKINWSLELCKIMIAMLDRSRDGIMQYQEFQELQTCLIYWYQLFCEFDHNRNGFIEANELSNIITNRFRYALSQPTMTTLLKRYSKVMDNGQCLVAFDDFVALAVRLRAYTEAFRARDRQQNGRETGFYQFSYDDFLQCTMCL